MRGWNSRGCLLLCISPAALASGWVALERSTAVHREVDFKEVPAYLWKTG